ncbi:flagellar hook-associated protein FlgL [Virgisporangium aurantiacum]|uniref:Flagellar hook-associated protein FlgL n=1 Tax=Virgisporangium aurantiacum TaxID=175570 RepID=A0A8J3YVS8_9ACTN|nr:flagellar hook-associated protein FlgL [Virgisporangium aurantiacum]GIJ52501.1 flagellar hook-associated protein FlgL [Virgisporangium aurantiacum]
MRVTHGSIAKNVLANLQGNISRMSDTQQRMSSGKQINRPSDSPSGTASAMELRAQLAQQQQYVRNIDDGTAWLNAADSALQGVDEKVARARSLVLQGMSAGSSGQTTRDALAADIRELSESIRVEANTTYLNRPVFAGNSDKGEAYTASGGFNGDGGTVVRTVGSNTKVAVNVDGKAVFGEGNDSIFSILSTIATKLESDPGALTGELDRLDVRAATIRNGLTTVGARSNQLERMRQSADDMALNVTKSLSDVEDIDLPQTITDLQLQQTAYQAALAAGARVVQPSLIDFLR